MNTLTGQAGKKPATQEEIFTVSGAESLVTWPAGRKFWPCHLPRGEAEPSWCPAVKGGNSTKLTAALRINEMKHVVYGHVGTPHV